MMAEKYEIKDICLLTRLLNTSKYYARIEFFQVFKIRPQKGVPFRGRVSKSSRLLPCLNDRLRATSSCKVTPRHFVDFASLMLRWAAVMNNELRFFTSSLAQSVIVHGTSDLNSEAFFAVLILNLNSSFKICLYISLFACDLLNAK